MFPTSYHTTVKQIHEQLNNFKTDIKTDKRVESIICLKKLPIIYDQKKLGGNIK